MQTIIQKMGRDKLLALRPASVTWPLSMGEVMHMASILGAFWAYDYDAARANKFGLHAELKSGLHSDGFFVSKILLESENIRRIMAQQMVRRIHQAIGVSPDYVAGIPDGATNLGKEVANILGVPEACMEKRDGKITLTTNVGRGLVLLVEDICTRGTALVEAATHIRASQRGAQIMKYNPVIINRGGLMFIPVAGIGTFKILPVVERRINDWTADECPLCKLGSRAIKPKATDQNWIDITTSQQR